MIIRFIGATSPYSQFRGMYFCCRLQCMNRNAIAGNELLGKRHIRRTKLPPNTPETSHDNHWRDGCTGHLARRLRSACRCSLPTVIPKLRTSKLVRHLDEISNKTLTSHVRASGSNQRGKWSPRATASQTRVNYGIDPETAYNQCSRRFSASWQSLPGGKSLGFLRPVSDLTDARVAYSKQSG